jgi:cell wall integrity and stress response component
MTTTHSSITETQTHGGVVTTITVDSSSATSAADSNTSTQDGDSDSGLSGGSIAGIVVGVLGGVALIVAAVIFFLAKRRQNDASNYTAGIDGRQSKGSQMSYANLGDNHSHTLSNGSSIPARLPTFTDNRLNTGAMLRRDSDISLQDNEDYSRPVLRVSFLRFSGFVHTDPGLAHQSRLIAHHSHDFP